MTWSRPSWQRTSKLVLSAAHAMWVGASGLHVCPALSAGSTVCLQSVAPMHNGGGCRWILLGQRRLAAEAARKEAECTS